jgi:2',3'-cyclic-nucleotide 2'-phosphodiesterase (5'-nucleotidase family)
MRRFITIILVLSIMVACKTPNAGYTAQKVTYSQSRITNKTNSDPAVEKFLQPYKDSVEKSMNGIICKAQYTFEKQTPEGEFGNILADAMLTSASNYFKKKVDFATLNNGGIRTQQLIKGNITRGTVFEFMPFDNELVLVQLSGKELQQLLDTAARGGGWPISGGTMIIKNNLATNVYVNNAPIDELAMYTIAISDYLANGGSNLTFLMPKKQEAKGLTVRDAIINYFEYICTKNALGIDHPGTGRVIVE